MSIEVIQRFTLSLGWVLAVLWVQCACLGGTDPSTNRTNPAASQPVDQETAALMRGDSVARLAIMKQMTSGPRGFLELKDSQFAAIARCCDDPSPEVRAKAAVMVGVRWIQEADPPLPSALVIEEKLGRDADLGVRHDAVTAGLCRVPKKYISDAVIAALVDVAMTGKEPNANLNFFVTLGLKGVAKERIISVLERYWANAEHDPDRAASAYVIFVGVVGEDPPQLQRLDRVGTFLIPFRVKGGYELEDVAKELGRLIPSDLPKDWLIVPDRSETLCDVVAHGVAERRKIIAALDGSNIITRTGDFGAAAELVSAEKLAEMRASYARAATRPASVSPDTYAAAFQQLYDHLGQVYPNFQMKGINWKAVGGQLMPQATRVKTEREFGLLVEELVATLEDSHAVVLAGSAQPPEPDLPEWDPGVACMIDDRDRPVVYAVEPGSPAEKAGINIGMEIVSVNGIPADNVMKDWMRKTSQYYGASSQRVLRYDAARGFLCQMRKGTPETLELEAPDGGRMSVVVAAACGQRYLPRLPVPREGINDSADVSWTTLPNQIGYIYVRRIRNGLEGSLDSALKDLGTMRGLVIDVRGNSGGGFDASTALVNFDTAPGDAAEQKRPRYTGPIAMLIDERCISAGEGWASWFVANHRAKLFGTATAGASSQKETYTLRNGLYQIVIPVKAYTGFLDRPIERRGLEPDVPVRCSAQDLSNGRDTVLETAARWLTTAVPR
jgi:carboxyl-terminal processing protease